MILFLGSSRRPVLLRPHLAQPFLKKGKQTNKQTFMIETTNMMRLIPLWSHPGSSAHVSRVFLEFPELLFSLPALRREPTVFPGSLGWIIQDGGD